jgi:dynein heavy chain
MMMSPPRPALQIIWTKEAERALNFARVEKNIMRRADRYFQGIMDKLITQTNRSDLHKLDRVKYEAIITIHIHQVDIFRDIYKMGIKVKKGGKWDCFLE